MTDFRTVPNVAPLVDGEPLTYDKLNELINAFRLLRSNVATLTNPNAANANYPKIDIVGRNANDNSITNAPTVSVKIGSQTFRNFESPNKREIIKFPNAFAQPPIVVAMLRKSASDAQKSKVLHAVISLINVTKDQFEVEVELIKSSTNLSDVRVDYIAVGAS